MLFRHPAHPDRAVRLAYCLNLHPAASVDTLIEGLRGITLPLRQRLAPGKEFGLGMYLPARLAHELARDTAQRVLVRDFLCEHGLDAFTYNAFPYDGFDRDGLKEHVFEPTWWERTRMEYTLDVARVAAALQGNATEGRHLSISTHTGAHSSQVPAANVADTRAKCF